MSGRFDNREMDVDYNPSGFNSFERSCDSNVIGAEQKDVFPQYTLQGVVHFLQTEWTRIESQRSDWDADRAEMKARIAFLEGERRGQENLKQDLVRRIKMLEYALKQERVRFHQFEASVNAGNAGQSDHDVAAHTPRGTTDASKSNFCEPLDKLNQCTKQAMESNTKWVESRSRLKKFLHEVGCTDALLNVRQARVLQLLKSTPEWRNAIAGLTDNDQARHQAPTSAAWPSGAYTEGRRNDGNAEVSEQYVRETLDEMDSIVQAEYGVTSTGANMLNDPPLSQQHHTTSHSDSTEPDTTAYSYYPPGTDMSDVGLDSGMPTSRFRRTGGAGNQVDCTKTTNRTQQSPNSQTGDGSRPDGSSATTAVSSFISGLEGTGGGGGGTGTGEDGSNPAYNVDGKIMDFVDNLSHEPRVNTPGTKFRGTSDSGMGSDQSGPTTTHNWSGGAELVADTGKYNSDNQVQPDNASKETGMASGSGLVLGDLATLTVANEVENAAVGGDGEQLEGPSRSEDQKLQSGANTEESTGGDMVQSWSLRFTLRGHFDAIRAIAFHATRRAVFTAGEDGSVMLWDFGKRNTASSAKHPNRSATTHVVDELEPVHVYCGHHGPVLCLAANPAPQLDNPSAVVVYSGGLDGTVRSWCLPTAASRSMAMDLYSARETEHCTGPVFRGSSAAVWSIAMHPTSPLLAAAHADGIIEFWNTDGSSESNPQQTVNLESLFTPSDDDSEPIGRPTCVQYLADHCAASQCLIGTSTGRLFLVDVNTGRLICHTPTPPEAQEPQFLQNLPEGWNSRGLNSLSAHPTLSFVAGAHEDGCVRVYNIRPMPMVSSSSSSEIETISLADYMVAHVDAITSLTIGGMGLFILTGSHDASIRVWDMESRVCLQELTEHRNKHNEAVHAVAVHPQFPFAASAGADGVCKIYDFSGLINITYDD